MLRGVFAIVLLVACFPEDSTAGSDDGSPVPGFSFVGTGTPRIAMSAPSGMLSIEDIQNTTAWQPTFNEDSVSISQEFVLLNASVVYPNATVSVDLLEKIGSVTARLSSNSFKATLTATDDSSNNSSCLLNIQIDMLFMGVDLAPREFGIVGPLLKDLVGILPFVVKSILNSLEFALTNILTEKMTYNLLNLDALCRTLAASNFTSYLEPSWECWTSPI